MQNKLSTITIGIPAYNEEVNLRHLIPEIMAQSHQYFKLSKILVISDGSTDETSKLKREFPQLPLQIIVGRNRKGKPARLNELFGLCKTDGVVVIDADTKLSHGHVLDILLKDLLSSQPVMISGHVEPFEPNNLIEKIAWAGVGIWTIARSKVPINSLYNCDGMIRVFSKEVYRHMSFKGNSAEDSYSYLTVVTRGWKFLARKKAIVYYRLPSTFTDYLEQQRRYLTSIDIMSLNFDPQLVKKELLINGRMKLSALIEYFSRDPFYTLLYLIFALYVRFSLLIRPQSHSSMWKILESTKRIRS